MSDDAAETSESGPPAPRPRPTRGHRDAAMRRRMFVHNFVAGPKGTRGDARKAAAAAGFNADAKNLDTMLQRLREHPEVQQMLRQAWARFDLTEERILLEYCRLAFSKITDVFRVDKNTGEISLENLEEIPDDVAAAIAEIKPVIHQETGQVYYAIKMHDKRAALEMLAKYRNMIRAPALNLILVQMLAGLDMTVYQTEELLVLKKLLERGLMPAHPSHPAQYAKPIKPPDLPPFPTNGQNGAGH